MRQRLGIAAALIGCAVAGASLESVRGDELPPERKPKKPNGIAHTQSREIARRLRQEARNAAKVKA